MITEAIKNLTKMFSDDDVIRKSELMLGLTNLEKILSNEIYPNLLQLVDYLNSSTKKVDAKKLNLNVRDNKELGKLLMSDYDLVLAGILKFSSLAEDELPKMMTLDTMTIKQSAIIEMANHFDSMISYMSSLMLHITYSLNNETAVYKKKDEGIVTMSRAYSRMMNQYRGKGLLNAIKDMAKLSNVEISDDPATMRELSSANDLKFKLPVSGFNGSLLYSLGKWWVEFQLKRADAARDEKRLIELKLMELRARDNGGNVPTELSSQIAFFENKLRLLEKKIEDLEEV